MFLLSIRFFCGLLCRNESCNIMSNNAIIENNELAQDDAHVNSIAKDENKESQSSVRKTYINDAVQKLPSPVKNRIKALKVIQQSCTFLETQFYKEVHELENKYHELYKPHFEKRCMIIEGTYTPTEDECAWDLDKSLEVTDADIKVINTSFRIVCLN